MPYVIVNFDNDYPIKEQTTVYDINTFINGNFNEIKATLNNIYKYSDDFSDYEIINKDIWLRYQIEKQIKIPRIGKEFKKSFKGEGSFKKHTYTTIKFVENKKEKKLKFKSSNLLLSNKNPNLFDNLENKYESYDLKVFKDAICNNLEEMVYVFLECLFSSKIIYHIKKCKHCGDFFITTKSDTKFCTKKQLIDNEEVSCSQIIAKLQKTYQYKQLMKIDKSNLASIINSKKFMNVDIDEYKKQRDYFKEKYFKTKNISELDDFIRNFLSKLR